VLFYLFSFLPRWSSVRTKYIGVFFFELAFFEGNKGLWGFFLLLFFFSVARNRDKEEELTHEPPLTPFTASMTKYWVSSAAVPSPFSFSSWSLSAVIERLHGSTPIRACVGIRLAPRCALHPFFFLFFSFPGTWTVTDASATIHFLTGRQAPVADLEAVTRSSRVLLFSFFPPPPYRST